MKRSLALLVVAGASTASVCAQSNVTIYGVIDLAAVHESGGPSGSSNKLTSGVFNGSRLGFRGTEDLGGGLSAIFVFESGFQADTGTLGQGGLIFGRQAYVGLTGAFGAVRLGRQYTANDGVIGNSDPFGAGAAGKQTNLLARGFQSRTNNTGQYFTPVIGGFSADVAYGFGEVSGNSSAGRYVGGSAGYASGPVYARLGHQKINDGVGSGAAKLSVLGASYNFGVAKAYFAYAVSKTDAAGVTTLDARDIQLGVGVPVGAGTILANYVRRDDRLAANLDGRQFALGYRHALSRRTELYAAAAHIKNYNGATYTVGSAIEAGTGNKAVNLGIQHRF